MSDVWDFYPLRVDGQPASTYVDLGIRSQVPMKSHPTMAFLSVQMLRPREDGLSSKEEFDDLIALEDRVTAFIMQHGSALFVGRSTSAGNRDFFFYIEDSARYESAARAVMLEFPAYKYATVSRDDPGWRTYLEFLHPSETDLQRIMNRRVLRNLESHGDNLENERKIDHVALLPSREAQSALKRHVQAQGFAIVNEGLEPNGDGQFALGFERTDRPSQIDEVALPLYEKVVELGGEYDGWGCTIAPCGLSTCRSLVTSSACRQTDQSRSGFRRGRTA